MKLLAKRAILATPGVRGLALTIYNHWFTTEAVTRRNTRGAYERLYRSSRLRTGYLTDSRLEIYEEFSELLIRLDWQSVLDVGCGTGHLLEALQRRRSGAHLVGVDHAEAGIVLGRRLVPRARFLLSDLYRLELDESFDLVVCSEVLEHLDRPDEALDRITRHACAGGTIAITVPNGATDDWKGHINYWTEAELSEWLAPRGEVETTLLDDDAVVAAFVRPD